MWGKASNKRITKLIRSTVETGVMSAAAAALDLALYLGFKHNNLHIAVYVYLLAAPPGSKQLLTWPRNPVR
jgi:hypothetical protein